MPTTAPKPAPPPAPKPAPAPPAAAAEPQAPSLPDGWIIFHRLAITDQGQQTIEAIASHPSGAECRTGPLRLAADFNHGEIRYVSHWLTELLIPQCYDVPAAASPALQLQQDPAVVQWVEPGASAPIAPIDGANAQPTATAAGLDAITAVIAAVEQLNTEWQTYVLETFRIEFGLPANRKLATAIKSQAHLDFIQSLLPS